MCIGDGDDPALEGVLAEMGRHMLADSPGSLVMTGPAAVSYTHLTLPTRDLV